MVSARLLTDLDIKFRSAIRDMVPSKRNRLNETRPFGGLNVLCCGDFWQFAPPVGGSLADIPVEWICRAYRYTPAATVSHGQSLFWAGPEFGMQGYGEYPLGLELPKEERLFLSTRPPLYIVLRNAFDPEACHSITTAP